MSKGERRDSSSYQEMTGSSFIAWPKVKESHGFRDRGMPQVSPIFLFCYFSQVYHVVIFLKFVISPQANKNSSFFSQVL